MLAHRQHILTALFFMGERNTFKAIIFCHDEHEIYPLVITEQREAFKEVSQRTVKDLHTPLQTASGFYLRVIRSSRMTTCLTVRSAVLRICFER